MTYIDFCKRFFQHALNGYAIHRMIFSPEGEPVDYKFLEVNDAFERLTGLDREDIVGESVREVIPGIKETDFIERYGEVVREQKKIEFEAYSAPLKRWYKVSAFPLAEDKFATIFDDISEKRKNRSRASYLSSHDELTGLLERDQLLKKTEEIDNPQNLPISIVIGDLDGLKIINKSLGFKKGDEFIKKAAEIIRGSVGSKAEIARWGGDEFVLVLPQKSEKEVSQLLDRIEEKCSSLKIENLNLSLSFGYALKKSPGQSLDEVFQTADDHLTKRKLLNGKSARGEIIDVLLKTLKSKSNETESHSLRMVNFSMFFGFELGFSDAMLDKLSLLATLHDIGKISVPEKILKKPDSLTEEEWLQIQKHPEVGANIIDSSKGFSVIAHEVMAHHEKWDGSGYPEGLSRKEIPLLARVIAIIDAYDVMTAGRPYQQPKSEKEALDELRRCAGEQFDPELVENFIKLVEEKEILTHSLQGYDIKSFDLDGQEEKR